MSSEAETAADVCCANCGAAEIDDIKLEECGGCDLVKYCSDKCREEHREQHEEECKKRKAELHDNELFTQPGCTHHGECPICFLPLPIDRSKSIFWSCCSNVICNGCDYANFISNKHDKTKVRSCAFCREPANDVENDNRMMKRVKANDPAAMRSMGRTCYDKGDLKSAIEYWSKATNFGDSHAHYELGFTYMKGEGVEEDMKKAAYHFEKAAIGGHPEARHALACIEWENGNIDRAVKHHIIAANLGFDKSMKGLWKHYSFGNITKEDLEGTLRTHKAAVDATKSSQRDAAEVQKKLLYRR